MHLIVRVKLFQLQENCRTASDTGANSQDSKLEICYSGDGETQSQVAQRGGRYPIPGIIPGQVGQGTG